MENLDLFIDTIQDFPYPTDATLDIFEDILVFSVNSLLQSKVDYLINYLIHYLEFFFKIESAKFLFNLQISFDSTFDPSSNHLFTLFRIN